MLFFQFVLLSSSLFFLLDACVTFDNQNVATCKETPSVGIVGDVKLKCALVQPSAKADSSNCHGKYYDSIDIGMFNLENMNSLIHDHYETVKTLFQLFKKNVGLGQWRTLSIVLQDLLSSTERHFTLDKDWFDGLTDYKPSVFAVLLLGMIANDWTSINVTINEDIYDIKPPPKAIIFFLWNSSEVFCTISIFPEFLPQHINVSEPCREVVTVISRSNSKDLRTTRISTSTSLPEATTRQRVVTRTRVYSPFKRWDRNRYITQNTIVEIKPLDQLLYSMVWFIGLVWIAIGIVVFLIVKRCRRSLPKSIIQPAPIYSVYTPATVPIPGNT